jgi:hypothetical protein
MRILRLGTLTFLLVAGCAAEVPLVPTTVNVATLKVHENQQLDRPDVKIAVAVVTPDNVGEAFKGLLLDVHWRETDHSQVHTEGKQQQTTDHSAKVSLLPLPLFVVRFANQSSSPLSFADAQVSLTDDKGKTFNLYAGVEELQGRAESDMMGKYPGTQGNQATFESMREIIGKQPIFTKKTTIAAKSDWQGFLVFKMEPRDLVELDQYLQSVGALTLKVGNVKGAQPFDLVVQLDKTSVPVSMSCPSGKPPTAQICKPRE